VSRPAARRVLAGAYEATSDLGALLGEDTAGESLALGPLALVHNPSAGPSSIDAEPDLHCVLHGELYNREELTRALGLPLDTPPERLLPAAYRRWGQAMIDQLRGAFVLVVWDSAAQTGFVARDHLGAGRSLYVHSSGRSLLFATEPRDLLRLLPRRPEPDSSSVVNWLTDARLPLERSLWEGISRVPGGHLLELDRAGWRRRRYWAPVYAPLFRFSREQLIEAWWSALGHAVSSRMGSDDSMGIIMSGGIDSAAVAAAAMTQGTAGRPHGYSAVFPGDERIDESERIEILTRSLGLPSTQIAIDTQGALALALDYLSTWEMPAVGPNYLVEYPLIEQAAEDGVTAVLDGQGGDELFGLAPFLPADRLRMGRMIAAARLVRRFPGGARGPLPWSYFRPRWRENAVRGALPYRLHQALRRSRDPLDFAPSYFNADGAKKLQEINDPWLWKSEGDGPRWWAHKASILTRDREEAGASEYAHRRAEIGGIRARPPLLDVDLVEFSLRVPPDLLYDRHYDRPLVREAMKGIVPDEVRLNRKKSNLAPLAYGSIVGGDFPFIQRVLGADTLEVGAHVDRAAVRRMVERPLQPGEGVNTWLFELWFLLSIELWLRFERDPGSIEQLRAEATLPRPSWRIHSRAEHGVSRAR
jgi:asparagine synthase (glutamine-hydrolysing)